MSDKPDLEKLARRYVDLWQEQLGALAKDPDMAEAMARTIELMNSGASAFASEAGKAMRSAGQPFSQDPAPDVPTADDPAERQPNSEPENGPDRRTNDAHGAATAAAASGAGDLGSDDVANRLAALERRIAKLEAGAKRRSGKPAGGSGSRSK